MIDAESVVNLLTPFNHSLDLSVILMALIISTINSIIISQIYKWTHRGMNFELSFMSTIVFLSPIVCLVMLFIRGDLVLSLGLIGSLSIIRFRTPIKDTRDMIFLFWSIATGLGCGTANWIIVIIATIFLSLLFVVFYFLRYGRSVNSDYVLVVKGSASFHSEKVEALLKERVSELKLRSYESKEGAWEAIYELRYSRSAEKINVELVDEIRSLEGVSNVSLLAPQLALPV